MDLRRAGLVVARPVGLALSFLGSGLNAREQVAAAWFGPKGFAAVVYCLRWFDEPEETPRSHETDDTASAPPREPDADRPDSPS